MDIWDYFYRQNEVAYSHKVTNLNIFFVCFNVLEANNSDTRQVCDSMLSSIAVQGTAQQGGKLVAMGDVTGSFSSYIHT